MNASKSKRDDLFLLSALRDLFAKDNFGNRELALIRSLQEISPDARIMIVYTWHDLEKNVTSILYQTRRLGYFRHGMSLADESMLRMGARSLFR